MNCPATPRTLRRRPTRERIDAESREKLVRQALTRFTRDKSKPEDVETLRHRLILARVENGWTALEAAERLGYANSTQLSLIESGQRSPPADREFVQRVARVYCVSADWLLGLSPDMEPVGKLASRFALLRGAENLMQDVLAGFCHAMQVVIERMQISPDEVERAISAAEAVEQRFAALRDRGDFDDLAGGAPVIAAIERLHDAIAPMRRVRAAYQQHDEYLEALRHGRLPEIPVEPE